MVPGRRILGREVIRLEFFPPHCLLSIKVTEGGVIFSFPYLNSWASRLKLLCWGWLAAWLVMRVAGWVGGGAGG